MHSLCSIFASRCEFIIHSSVFLSTVSSRGLIGSLKESKLEKMNEHTSWPTWRLVAVVCPLLASAGVVL